MNKNYNKYSPYPAVEISNRQWPNNLITKAPTWCSVDSVSYTHLTLPTNVAV